MAYGYNLSLTPLQTLAFYNAIANNGQLVKPRFIKSVKEFDKTIESFDKKILKERICSDKTLEEIQEILKNVVVRGTAKSLYSSTFSMAGKTGTAQTDYWMKDWQENKRYISSFAGYFPADNPKYSCIVVIHKPSTKWAIMALTFLVRFLRESHKRSIPIHLLQTKLKSQILKTYW